MTDGFDFSKIEELDEQTSDFVLSILISSLNEMEQIIDSERAKEQSMTPQQVAEVTVFYKNAIDLFIEREMYEECTKAKKVLEFVENLTK
jgi:hypothetical protein